MKLRVNLIYDRNSEILIEVYFKPIFEFIFLVLSNRNNKKYCINEWLEIKNCQNIWETK